MVTDMAVVVAHLLDILLHIKVGVDFQVEDSVDSLVHFIDLKIQACLD
jgi:hypothetical protein